MSLEMGGRSDKYGNQYENRYLARLLLRLVNEEISSIIVEPLGADSDSVEFVSEHDGAKEYYQCKASNIDHDSWTIADLKRHKVFSRAKQIILGGEGQEYFFICVSALVSRPQDMAASVALDRFIGQIPL